MDYYQALLADNKVIEFRLQLGGYWKSYFAETLSQVDLVISIAADNKADLYNTINKPTDNLIFDCGKFDDARSSALLNDEIARITRLPFDFDPIRPKNSNSNAEELRQAQKASLQLANYFAMQHLPPAIHALSGNGWHLHYKADLPNDKEHQEKIRLLYNTLKKEFSTKYCDFDSSVSSPAQIMRSYDKRLKNRKSKPQTNRPTRALFALMPHKLEAITPQQFDALISKIEKANPRQSVSAYPKKNQGENVTGEGDFSTLDIVAWFESLGLYQGHIQDNIHACHCPFEHEHTTESRFGDTVIFEAEQGQWAGFHCKHSHCQGRTIIDVINTIKGADHYCTKTYRG